MIDCIFCKIVKKEIPADVIFENGRIIAFLDIKPINPGHTLIVPKEHHEDLLETPDVILHELVSQAKRIAKIVVPAVKAEGFNLCVNTKTAAGQDIFHTHIHLIPRFSDDGLKPWERSKRSIDKNIANLLKPLLQHS